MPGKRRRPQFLVIDFGSSRIRAAVAPALGAPLAVVSNPVRYHHPEDAPDAARELDPAESWQLLAQTARAAVRESGVNPSEVAGLGVTSQRLGIALLDEERNALYAGPNTDLRAVFQGAAIDQEAGDFIWRMCGHGPGFLLAWSKLRWFKEEKPWLFEQASHVVTLADWLVERMTGALGTERASAAECGLADVTTGLPARSIARRLGLGGIEIPPARDPGAVAGELLPEPADEFGLHPGIPVVSAGPDTQAGLVGLGAGEAGQVGVMTGWSAAVQYVTRKPVFDSDRGLWTGRHVLLDRWVTEGNAGEMGGAYGWLASLLAPGEDEPSTMARFDHMAARVPPGASGASAFLGPALVNMRDAGMRLGGLAFPVPLSFEPPDVPVLVRAALESFAFAVRANLERLEEVTGGPASTVSVGGGMVRTRTFRTVLANVLGRPVRFAPSGEATVLGAATVTAAAMARGPEIQSLLHRRFQALREIEPGPADAAEYEDLYRTWRERAAALGRLPV
ncbi:MAG: FGGY-family carbohydrate kinase [Chloroflexi bacterium]|nr:FGGY-family carbohydrate kinase [Chloroflexota bacterium]